MLGCSGVFIFIDRLLFFKNTVSGRDFILLNSNTEVLNLSFASERKGLLQHGECLTTAKNIWKTSP